MTGCKHEWYFDECIHCGSRRLPLRGKRPVIHPIVAKGDAVDPLAAMTAERDAALAQVAGAYEAAALFCDETAAEALDESGEASRILNVWFKGQARAIRAITPADATAALDRIKRQARIEGLQQAYDLSGGYHQVTHIRAAILAAIKGEEQQ